MVATTAQFVLSMESSLYYVVSTLSSGFVKWNSPVGIRFHVESFDVFDSCESPGYNHVFSYHRGESIAFRIPIFFSSFELLFAF